MKTEFRIYDKFNGLLAGTVEPEWGNVSSVEVFLYDTDKFPAFHYTFSTARPDERERLKHSPPYPLCGNRVFTCGKRETSETGGKMLVGMVTKPLFEVDGTSEDFRRFAEYFGYVPVKDTVRGV